MREEQTMATREQVFLTVIVKLSNLGRPLYDPSSSDYDAYLNEYLEALGNFEWDTLTRAMEMVRGEWSALTWPPPGRIAQACIAAERERRAALPPPAPDRPRLPPPYQQTPRGRAVTAAKMGRLRELMATDALGRLTEDEARRFCETGDYPEDWREREAAPKPKAEAQPRTAREKQRDSALQAGAEAARAAFLGEPAPAGGEMVP